MSVFYVWYMWKRKHVTVAKRVAALAGNLAFGWGVLIVTGLALGMGSRTSVGTLAMWPETLGVGLPFILFTVVLLRRAHVLPGDPLMIAAEKAAKKAEEEAQKRAKQTKAAEEKQAKQAKVEEEKQRRMRLKKEENARMELSSKSDRQKVSVLRQIPLFMHRSLLQYTRHWMATIFDLLLVISAGLFAGIIYYHVYYIASPLADAEYLDDVCEGETSTACMMVTMPAQDPFPGQASITCLGLALAGVASSMRVFGDELVIFRRESEAGLSTEAYCTYLALSLCSFSLFIASDLRCPEYLGVVTDALQTLASPWHTFRPSSSHPSSSLCFIMQLPFLWHRSTSISSCTTWYASLITPALSSG